MWGAPDSEFPVTGSACVRCDNSQSLQTQAATDFRILEMDVKNHR